MSLLRISAIVFASALATGCAGVSTSVRELTPAQLADPQRGTIIVSTGAVERCTGAGAAWAPIYDAATHKLAAGSPVVPVDERSDSDYADHYGTLSALSLPAGRYVMSVEAANPAYVDIDVPTFAFEVVAGHARYLGSLLRATPCGKAANFAVLDRYDADVGLAARLNAALAAHPPERALMQMMPPTSRR
jgi:hypothetical protein